MSATADPEQSVGAYFAKQDDMSLLRFITCGSVDNGKSTLIGRLLLETKQILDDQLSAVERASRRYGTQGQQADLALLVDGLAAEREQGITIDVAYRSFATDKRRFIVADTPGHEQYTRNMATGASTADLAVILVDARHGLTEQTFRHSHIVALMGTPHVVLAVNKMDIVEDPQAVFADIRDQYDAFGETLFKSVTAIPVSALTGANVTKRDAEFDWYDGPTLLEVLETVEIASGPSNGFAMPVQLVQRPNSQFRGFGGLVASGTVGTGDEVRIVPSGRSAKITSVFVGGEGSETAAVGQSVTLCLDQEIDISRGDAICSPDHACSAADQFEATLLWMDEQPLLPGRDYFIKCAASTVPATVTRIKHKTDVTTQAELAAEQLTLNEMGRCNISLSRKIPFAPYSDTPQLGAFILIDRQTNATAALGMIEFALNRASNIRRQNTRVDRAARSEMKGHQPAVLWFTGLSGSGKSTIADLVEQKLAAQGVHTMLLDGDNVRHGLNRDLGFKDADRVENVRRMAEITGLFFEAGMITLVSVISPFTSERRMARNVIERTGEDGCFIEVFVDTPLKVAEQRDVKGLYAKARTGEIKNFTGIDSPYERPDSPEIHIDTTELSAEESADRILSLLRGRGIIS